MSGDVHGRDATQLEIEMAEGIARMQDEIHALRAQVVVERGEKKDAETRAREAEVHNDALRQRAQQLQVARNAYRFNVETLKIENVSLRAQRDDLLAACQQMRAAMTKMGNDLNWEMSDYGYVPPEHPMLFPVSYTEAMQAGYAAIAAATGVTP